MTALFLTSLALAATGKPAPAPAPPKPDPNEMLEGTEPLATDASDAPAGPTEPTFLLGAHLGVTESSGTLGVGPWPRVEAGYLAKGGRFAALGEVGFTIAGAHDAGADPQKYTYTATVGDLRVGADGLARLAPPGEAITPEVSLSAQLHVIHVGIATEVGGTDAGRVGQTLVRPGGTARFGVAAKAGPGEIPVDLVLDVVPIGGDLAGPFVNAAVGVSVGWRAPVRTTRLEER